MPDRVEDEWLDIFRSLPVRYQCHSGLAVLTLGCHAGGKIAPRDFHSEDMSSSIRYPSPSFCKVEHESFK